MRILIATLAATALTFAGSGIALADTVDTHTTDTNRHYYACGGPHSVNVLTCVNVLDDLLWGHNHSDDGDTAHAN